MNLVMIHGLFNVSHVGSVYWTLEIELIFYAWAMLLYLCGRLDKVHAAVLVLLALKLVYFLAERFAGVELSWTVSHFLSLPFIVWFVCGIVLCRLTGMAPTPAPFAATGVNCQLPGLDGAADQWEAAILAGPPHSQDINAHDLTLRE